MLCDSQVTLHSKKIDSHQPYWKWGDNQATGGSLAWGGNSASLQPGIEVGSLARYRPAESRLKEIAVPMTSCMSEPTMASSMLSQRRMRGAYGEEMFLP